jgi:hypothetical protein
VLAHETDMQRGGRTDELGNLISLWSVGEIVEEPLAATEQRRRVRQMHLIDEAGPEILLNRRDAAGQPYVFTVGRSDSPLKGRFNTVGDEVEDGSALHRD